MDKAEEIMQLFAVVSDAGDLLFTTGMSGAVNGEKQWGFIPWEKYLNIIWELTVMIKLLSADFSPVWISLNHCYTG